MKSQISPLMAANLAAAAAIAVITGVLALILFAPQPSTAQLDSQRRAEERKIVSETLAARTEADRLDAEIAAKVWPLPTQEVGPAALARATEFAGRRNVKLSAFRPQRQQEVDGLSMLPFSMVVEGRYPQVLEFVQELENPASRLSVVLVQVAGADGATDTVTATIGVAAFVRQVKENQQRA
jgi:Tfp pilus assembly protein PilO